MNQLPRDIKLLGFYLYSLNLWLCSTYSDWHLVGTWKLRVLSFYYQWALDSNPPKPGHFPYFSIPFTTHLLILELSSPLTQIVWFVNPPFFPLYLFYIKMMPLFLFSSYRWKSKTLFNGFQQHYFLLPPYSL